LLTRTRTSFKESSLAKGVGYRRRCCPSILVLVSEFGFMEVQGSYTWTKLNTEGLSGAQYRVPDCHARRFFVNLDRCFVCIDPYNLCYCNIRSRPSTNDKVDTSDQFFVTDTNEFVHGRTGHILCDDDWTGDAINLAKPRLAVLVTDFWKVFLCIR
jgi:hypothetical protein